MLSKQDGRYLRDFRRRTAETRNGAVTAALGDGRYTVRLHDTGASVNASALQAVTLAVGNPVMVRQDASGRARGSAFLIVGKLQDSDSGLLTGVNASTENSAAETITELPDLPVQLVANGDSVRVVIFGSDLLTAATYGHASITNGSGQEIDGRSAVLHPVAGAVPAGRYSLTIAGVTIPNFFEVTT